jgi:CheY-like chemotaxis protein
MTFSDYPSEKLLTGNTWQANICSKNITALGRPKMEDTLKGKRVLIVDDEADILETLRELLDMCLIDTAPNFDTAEKFLNKNTYDVAVLDIMGVRGYDLLKLATEKGIPALMLTAHALSPENLVKSIKGGAQSYVPKDKISDIPTFLADILKNREKGIERQGTWFSRLKPFFDKKFGSGWRKQHKDFWKEFDDTYRVQRDEIEKLM